jgi:hypothetical protein
MRRRFITLVIAVFALASQQGRVCSSSRQRRSRALPPCVGGTAAGRQGCRAWVKGSSVNQTHSNAPIVGSTGGALCRPRDGGLPYRFGTSYVRESTEPSYASPCSLEVQSAGASAPARLGHRLGEIAMLLRLDRPRPLPGSERRLPGNEGKILALQGPGCARHRPGRAGSA